MKLHEEKSICQTISDKASGCNQKLTANEQQHISSCSECKQVLSLISQLQQRESAYDSSDISIKLRNRIISKITPLVTKPPLTLTQRIWQTISAFKLQFSVATAFDAVVLLTIFNFSQSTPIAVDTYNNSSHANNTYQLTMHGKTSNISLDEPILVDKNQIATAIVPDGSTLEIKGPSRLTINERGFHLAYGILTAEVVKASSDFKGTTTHAIITVLGTKFTVDAKQRSTRVEVLSGRVAVTSNDHYMKILNAGDSHNFYSGTLDDDGKYIPPINRKK